MKSYEEAVSLELRLFAALWRACLVGAVNLRRVYLNILDVKIVFFALFLISGKILRGVAGRHVTTVSFRTSYGSESASTGRANVKRVTSRFHTSRTMYFSTNAIPFALPAIKPHSTFLSPYTYPSSYYLFLVCCGWYFFGYIQQGNY